ncbi:MAG: multidrug effflux MFS transporter [Rhodobacter sp.]|uniref:multidrug effflux MFS transporter n=1 Tax=Pararhodobacter sp. TaxID=2127056 RepID=UPI001DC83F49|nr:multidrug effflux MFS transporter [Pararhodobacter sp.]MCB1344028.1 multidrug effflux MFS transporter [Paracoccaceae bacterium]MCC0074915.1 multidrug effflux MFS transporter [Rhodobacter sp.]HPD91381.1 multidrug effflux MFS transporter [Pararhodobacter sp.]
MRDTAPTRAAPPPNLLLAALTACGLMALTAYAPALPRIVTDLHAPPARVQLTMSLYFLIFATGQLLGGPLSDRLGRRPVALGGMALFATGSLIGATAGSLESLLAGRMLQALGGAAGAMLARAIIKDVFPADQVARALTQVVMISALVPIVAPVLGGYLADWLGWRSILWVLGAYGTAVFAALALLYRETAPPGARRPLGAYPRIYRGLIGNRAFMGYTLNAGAFAVAYFSFLSGMPIALTAATGMGTAEFGRWFALMPAAYLAGNALSSRLLRVHDAARMLRAGSLVSTTGAAAMLACWAVFPPGPAAVFLPALLLTAGHGMAMNSATALSMNSAPDSPGTAAALMGAINMACAGLGTLLVATPSVGAVVAIVLAAQSVALLLATARRRG